MQRDRESTGEMVRLVAMLLIVAHHFFVHALYPDVLSFDIHSRGWDHWVALGGQGFFYVGVNMFVLLSGWYSIRLKPRSVINLWSILFFYAAAHEILHLIAVHYGFSDRGVVDLSDLYRVLFPVSHTPYWFITCYVALMLLSPILNAALDTLKGRPLRLAMVCLVVINVYLGWFWSMGMINSTGFTVMQFIWIYLLGGCLRRTLNAEWLRKHRWQMLGVYAACCLVWGIGALLQAHHQHTGSGIYIPHFHGFTYCNPLIVGAALGLFLFLMSLRSQSKAVNWWAASVLAVYILQEGFVPYPRVGQLFEGWSPLARLGMVAGLTVVFMPTALLVDKVRMLMMKPLWKLYDRKVAPRLSAWF